MMDKIKKTIHRFHMLKKGDTVAVCLSGGIDSVVLLHLLAGLAEEYRLSLIAVHVNHSLRGKESDRDEAFARNFAKKLNVKFICRRIDTRMLFKRGDSLQDIARGARYKLFEDIAERYSADRIATGHNMTDLAETIVMRFLKGAGLSGLSGIPPVRGRYIRPLIELNRQEIEEYACRNGLRFVRDSSNKSMKYLRNRIRLKLMPILEGYNPRLTDDMARLARLIARDDDYIRDKAIVAYNNAVKRRDEGAVSLNLKKLTGGHDSLRTRIFFMAVEELLGSSKGFYSCHAEDYLKLVSGKAPNASVDLPRNLRASREYDIVRIEKRHGTEGRTRAREQDISFEKEIRINGDTDIIADRPPFLRQMAFRTRQREKFRIALFKSRILNSTIRIHHPSSSSVAYFDYDKLSMPLTARNFRTGDRFVPLGMKGRKKVKDLFIERKVARQKRRLVPLIVSGGEIIWVAGIRQGDCGKIGPGTRRILKIEMKTE